MARSLKDGEALKVHHCKCLQTEVHYDCIIMAQNANKQNMSHSTEAPYWNVQRDRVTYMHNSIDPERQFDPFALNNS